MNFDKYLEVERRIHDGKTIQKVYRFPNGYGASVVQGPYSYGGAAGQWEIAMVKYYSPEKLHFDLSYDDGEFEDVIGYLADNEVDRFLQYIFNKEVTNA